MPKKVWSITATSCLSWGQAADTVVPGSLRIGETFCDQLRFTG